MSCDKWAYTPEKCDGVFCVGDCDLCKNANDDVEELDEEHKQLAEWLKELQTYRKIISELSEAMRWYDGCEECQGFREYSTRDFVDNVRDWVKQFEEVNANENRY